MKQIVLALLIVLTTTTIARSEGIEFFHGTWQEALAEAARQEKPIFVDAYAVWCGPCKRMAAEVFTDAAVGDFYNQHFVNVKMDMEQGEGLTFRKKYPVSAFPTLFYIDYTGDLIQAERGARPADAFIALGRTALSKIDRSGQFAEAYDRGDRSPELVYNYIKALNKAGKPTLKIANDYLRDQKDLTTESNLRIIFEGATEADSKIFDWLIEYKNRITALESAEAVRNRIRSACEATVRKGIEYQYRDLVDNAVGQMKKYCPDQAATFAVKADLDYALAVQDAPAYTRAARDYAKKVIGKDAKALHELAQSLAMNFQEDEGAMKQAEATAEEAARLGKNYGYYLTYASILAANGKRDDARKAAEQSLQLAKKEGEHAVQNVNRFLEQLQN